MIIGTAGHIDHGKTTLVRALTGVDTDRLPEEKRRGISIELGYAYLHAPDGVSLGFVDVPGHERLLHTMLAGATGIDHALLVVAADDGVMPQTREHFAVVALLGVREATVTITKIDRIDEAVRESRLAEVRAGISALLAPTPLAGAPMLAVSATTGEGIDALRERLLEVARQEHSREEGLAFRLAVDRSFSLSGVGTVVTGTVFSGTVRIGDELRIAPGSRTVRVRGIHAQNQQAESAHAGQRCALALAGVGKDEVHRGEWVCTPSVALASARIDVLLTLWPDEARPLRSGATVHAHLGASDVMASVALLDRDALAPGETALAQLVLREPAGAWHGDRGVLRDASATRTVAGVRVLDPFAPVRYRRTPERLRTLAAWAIDERAARVAALLHNAPLGIDTAQAARALSLADEEALPLPADAVRIGHTAIARSHLGVLEEQIAERLADFHRTAPNEVGPDARRLKRLAGPRTDDALWRHALDELVARGTLVRSGTWLHLPDHAARLNEAEQKLAQKLLPRLADGGFDPPWVRDLAKDCAASEAMVRQTLASLARRGETFQVVKDLYYPLATVERLAAIARDCLDGPAGLEAASFRDATGLGRKRAIQLLEFFDRVGYTRRVKDTHLLRPDTSLFGAKP
ncbi:selenocysteine-specific translation elongation factor [Variovorax atrisoli]|uniref:selenocysteine-specific translation elongation factor n=1 Tax=Variovorax atrisoli TaxID=3394203 RepID=UPI000F7E9921|nr:selenocysteine-specific translation elongation factor [Variovorax sp. 369]RTD94353.1 selenocysteine-specific translation elongation factor [Variovorax sp. 369]